MIQRAAENALSFLDNPKTTRVFQFIALMSLMLGVFVGVKQYTLTECLADYNEAANANQSARAQAAEQDRQSQREIFTSFSEALNGPPAEAATKIRVALARWQAQQEASDRQRQQNPIPPPPSATCG